MKIIKKWLGLNFKNQTNQKIQLNIYRKQRAKQGYIEQQYNTNMGIFDYFLQYYKEIIDINQKIENYTTLKGQIKNSQNLIEYVIININEVEALDQFKKKKQIIINKIIETSQYKNQEIDKMDQNFIKSQITENCRLGTVFLEQKQYQSAIQCYDTQIKSNPDDPQNSVNYFNKGQIYYYDLGYCLKNQYIYEEAIQIYDKAIKLNPQNSEYYFQKGKSLVNLQRYEEAIQFYDKAITLNPQNSDYYYNKGISLKNLQRYEEAEIMFHKQKQIQQQQA